MNKSDLIEQIAFDAGITKADAARALDAATAAIARTLKAGGSVTIPNFGKFTVTSRPARSGISFDRRPIKIDASRTVKFTNFERLKWELN